MIRKTGKEEMNFTHFIKARGVYIPSSENPVTLDSLPPGIYKLKQDRYDSEPIIQEMQTISDSLVDMPNTASERICKDLQHFWKPDTEKQYGKYGIVYKRGILLYGPPGTGKTCTVAKVMDEVVKMGGIVFFEPAPAALIRGVLQARHLTRDMKVLVVYEEFEKNCQGSDFLSMLDGEMQVENIVFLATTNHIDKIPDKIKNRPGRFAHRVEMGMPNAEARRAFIKAKLHPEDKVDIEAWVAATDGMSVDHIKDLIVSVMCMGVDLDKSLDKLKAMQADKNTDSSEEDDDIFDDFDDEDNDTNDLGSILNDN